MESKYFVPYETAKLLKQKGYNEPCTYYYGDGIIRIVSRCSYTNEKLSNNTPDWLFNECISAPTYHEVLDWFEEKGVRIYAEYCESWIGFIDYGDTEGAEEAAICQTREEALNEGILKALEKL